MKDDDFVEFLQWALPRLDKRWEGFRKPRGQVKKRLQSRLEELELNSLEEYRDRLEEEPGEWEELDFITRVTISKFYRNVGAWDFLREEVLPALVERARSDGRETLRAWSAGAASGEEAYTLRIAWEMEFAEVGLDLAIEATDIDEQMIERARRARYPDSSVAEMPREWVEEAFEFDESEEEVVLKEAFRDVDFSTGDVTESVPEGPFDLVMASYVVFIYYDESVAEEFVTRLGERVRPGAALLVGPHETPPDSKLGGAPLEQWDEQGDVYRFVVE